MVRLFNIFLLYIIIVLLSECGSNPAKPQCLKNSQQMTRSGANDTEKDKKPDEVTGDLIALPIFPFPDSPTTLKYPPRGRQRACNGSEVSGVHERRRLLTIRYLCLQLLGPGDDAREYGAQLDGACAGRGALLGRARRQPGQLVAEGQLLFQLRC
uniref:SFRICE_031005 n=1 Tax=Spodoptera frugiperda TaxID=7108 RepID=A0A2H1X2F3_SPOFR